jgi:hypothetical protein
MDMSVGDDYKGFASDHERIEGIHHGAILFTDRGMPVLNDGV